MPVYAPDRARQHFQTGLPQRTAVAVQKHNVRFLCTLCTVYTHITSVHTHITNLNK